MSALRTSTKPRRSVFGGSRPIWMEKPGPVEQVLRAAALVLVVFLVIYPFWSVIATSLADQADIARQGGLVLIPANPSFDAYRILLSGGIVTQALLVSIGITVVGTAINLVMTISLAYALSRPSMVGHKPFLLLALFTMLFSAGIIPNFLLVKSLGLLNSYAALIVPGMISAFNLVVMRNFFMNIPEELTDSARIDGAGELRILVSITLPLSKAVIAVIGLFYAVEHWNSFFGALIYLNDSSKWPLSLVLRAYVLQGQQATGAREAMDSLPPEQSVQMAVVVIALVPILLVYPFLQKYFTKGVLTGAVKG